MVNGFSLTTVGFDFQLVRCLPTFEMKLNQLVDEVKERRRDRDDRALERERRRADKGPGGHRLQKSENTGWNYLQGSGPHELSWEWTAADV